MKVYQERIKLRMPTSHGRSKGLHVSEVIRDLAVNGKILDKKWVREIAIELQDTTLMQCGFAWEDYLENSNQHPEIEYHPGELVVRMGFCAHCGEDRIEHSFDCDHVYLELKIYMSPDGFTWDEYKAILLYLNEIKFTKKSCRDFAQGLRMGSKKSLMYVWQILAYLKGTGTLSAKLHVLFINGNYSFDDQDPEAGAVAMIFRLEFEQWEVDANWRMLAEHARTMIRTGKYNHAKRIAA